MNHTFKALQLKAQHQVYTLLSGHNLSKLHGEGYDFSELREYQVGDDIRKINWMITAKRGKPYIKELHANRELSVVVACLMDASLYFGSANSHSANAKQTKLAEVATTLGYATHQSTDLFTGLAYMQNQTQETPATKQLYHIEQFSQTLFEANLLGTRLEPQRAIDNLFKRIQKPSLAFVLGDFLEEVDLSLLAQKHEVIAITIRDKEEESISSLGEVTLTNPQNNKSLETYFGKKSKQAYQKKRIENDEKNAEHFTRNSIRSIKIFTDEDVVSRLITLFV